MSRRKEEKGRLSPFVPLLISTLDTTGWRATSHGARSLYIALKRRYNVSIHNNGRLYLSERMAKQELRSDRTEIRRWFRELQHYGFIVQTTPGSLGLDGKGKAPHWRLTELGVRGNDGRLEPPTNDFLRWRGVKFRVWEKQNPGGEIPSRVEGKSHPPVEGKSHPHKRQSGGEIPSIQVVQGGGEIPSITRLTTGGARILHPEPEADEAIIELPMVRAGVMWG